MTRHALRDPVTQRFIKRPYARVLAWDIPSNAEALEIARTLQEKLDPLHSPTLYRLVGSLIALGAMVGFAAGYLIGRTG